MEDIADVAPSIRKVVAKVPSAQPGIAWPRDAWSRRFPQLEEKFAALPDLIDRATVKEHAQLAIEGPAPAEWGFVVAMVWGYGTTGYGPWRVEQMLASIEEAGVALHRVATTMVDEGPVGAYSLLAGEAKMTKLGPAFGTKFLYFCKQVDSGFQALILDRLVADWLADNTDVKLNPVPWNRWTYERYLQSMHGWAAELKVAPEELERSIFQSQANARGGQWST